MNGRTAKTEGSPTIPPEGFSISDAGRYFHDGGWLSSFCLCEVQPNPARPGDNGSMPKDRGTGRDAVYSRGRDDLEPLNWSG